VKSVAGAKVKVDRGSILVGTTSWTEATLLSEGHFYPPSVRTPEARLRYYASIFPIVEVDSSFYAMPAERNAELWSQRTAAGFVFDVKSFRLFTQHRTPAASLPADLRAALSTSDENVYYPKVPSEIRTELWRRFRAGLEPLRASNRLGVVLFQFAPWAVFSPDGLRHIEHCAERMEGFRLAVELRNVSWLGGRHRNETLACLRDLGLAHVIVDEPQETSFSVPAVWDVTCPDLAVFRLHGRNRTAWRKKDLGSASERFAYRYRDEELKGFVAPIKRLAARADEVHVLFNNCHADWAQRDAMHFREMLGKAAVSVPSRPDPPAAARTGKREGHTLHLSP
jgi:uncharacterized protein YecE (DUF72 family)